MIQSGALFGLFEKTSDLGANGALQREDDAIFNSYLRSSNATLRAALNRVRQAPFAIYGAGSHTARLLPELEKTHANQIIAIVDSNANLIGKTIGRWSIQSPDALANMPHVAVLVSSFRSQNEIAASLAKRFSNDLILMYS